jgi:hypothetical protein
MGVKIGLSHGLRVHKGHEVRRYRSLLHEELHNLHSSPNINRVVKSSIIVWAKHVARMGDRRGTYRDLAGKHEMGLLGRQ